MIFEIARFWSSLIIYNFDSDRYGIQGMIMMDLDEFQKNTLIVQHLAWTTMPILILW